MAAIAIGGGLLLTLSLSGSLAYAMSGNAASNVATSGNAASNVATSGTTTPAADTTTPAAGTTTPAAGTTPATTTPVAPSLPVPYTTYEGAECFVPSYDLGYQGVKTAAEVQAACDANTRCAGATQHSGGDWWLLSGVHINNTTLGSGNKCILKSGKSIV